MKLPRVAVLIPCYNEVATIGNVVRDFRAALPGASVFVYDNNSSDDTRGAALAAGAIVRTERHQGKGNVVRRMFSDVEADVYVMVDGDDTYDASAAPALIQHLLDESLDMVNGRRITEEVSAYRSGHRLGNRMLTGLVCWFFGEQFKDMLSGFRVFSRRFVKSFPALSQGFEIETELTVHALNLRMPVGEVDTVYRSRPEGSVSKLNTYRDGIRILKTIMILVKEEMPLQFFSCVGAVLGLISLALGIPVVDEFLQTGLVPRLPMVLVLSVVATVVGIPGLLPFSDALIALTAKLNFLAFTTPVLALAGFSVAKDLPVFRQLGWRIVVVSLTATAGTFLGATLIAEFFH